MTDTITLPREVVLEAVEALELAQRVFGGYSTEIEALRKALAAEQPKHDLMKWAKDAGSSPEDLERFATYTIATRDMEIATLREENEALRRDAERYRWLRDQTTHDGCVIAMKNKHIDDEIGYAENIDRFIDAAMGDKR